MTGVASLVVALLLGAAAPAQQGGAASTGPTTGPTLPVRLPVTTPPTGGTTSTSAPAPASTPAPPTSTGTDTPRSIEPPMRAFLGVTINTKPAGEALVLIRDNGRDVLLPPAALEGAGLRALRVTPELIDGAPCISLADIKPKVSYQIDDDELMLRVTAPPALFGTQRIDLRPHEPEGTRHVSSAALFANYGLNWMGTRHPSLSGEVGASLGPALLLSTVSRSPEGVVTRGLSTLTIDRASSMVRFSAGDFAMRGGALWGSGLVTGVAVSREFSLDPYFVRFPTPQLVQTLSTPSTVDVYVNDRLVRRTELQPGVFDITGIPALTGAGSTRVVVRDGFGRAQTFDTSYYVTSAVLAPGLHDFQYAIGSRERFALGGGDHREAASLTHRVGLTNSLTIGVHAEGDRALVSGGPTLTARLGRFGDFEATFGVSRTASRETGRAISAAWSYLAHGRTLSWFVRASTGGFVSFGTPQTSSTRRLEWSATASTPVPLLGVVSATVQQQWLQSVLAEELGSWRRTGFITGSRRVSNRVQFQWRAGGVWTPTTRSREASVSLIISMGRTAAALESVSRDRRVEGSLSVARPLPIDDGVGFRVRADQRGEQMDGALQAQNHMIRAEARMLRMGGITQPGLILSGGVVAMGGTLALTNGLGDSYALVEVPGVSGVRVYSNNALVGRTGRDGRLFVPRMLPNYANRLSISDLDLPTDHTVAEGEKLIAPPLRGGAIVTFHQETMESVVGQLVWLEGGERKTPAFGLITVTVNGRVIESPISLEGGFFLEQLPAGAYMATVSYRGDQCAMPLTVPSHKGTIADVGTLTCVISQYSLR